MLGQLKMMSDGTMRDKVEMAVERLRAFEPKEGYYVGFSGGKDSQCIYHLAKMAGVKFEAHYCMTSVDPPEVINFIRKYYPDAWDGRLYNTYPDGRRITMWNLIPKEKMPPTRRARYCCDELKESIGPGRFTVTGVRWAESANRRKNQGVITVFGKGTALKQQAEESGLEYSTNRMGGVILNYDDDEGRRVSEFCFRTNKKLLNPIIDWDDDDVWQFLNENNIPHCCLYDEGWKRIGCIGCPMHHAEGMKRDFDRWPKFKELYIQAFDRMNEARVASGLEAFRGTGREVLEWWIGDDSKAKGGEGLFGGEEY